MQQAEQYNVSYGDTGTAGSVRGCGWVVVYVCRAVCESIRKQFNNVADNLSVLQSQLNGLINESGLYVRCNVYANLSSHT